MKKNITALVVLLGGILYASIWTKIIIYAINYRQIRLDAYWLLLIVVGVVLYISGIYISAALFQFYSKREITIIPSTLALGSILGFILGYSIVLKLSPLLLDTFPILNKLLNYQSFDSDMRYLLGSALLFSLLGIRAACAFDANKHSVLVRPIRGITTVIVINLILYFWLAVSTSFPGVNAPLEMRQKWAYQEFDHYGKVVQEIKLCEPITDKVGKTKFVAPTKGRNIYTREGGSGDRAEFTLEVVGEKGTGVAYVSTALGGIRDVSLKYQGKKTSVTCVRSN